MLPDNSPAVVLGLEVRVREAEKHLLELMPLQEVRQELQLFRSRRVVTREQRGVKSRKKVATVIFHFNYSPSIDSATSSLLASTSPTLSFPLASTSPTLGCFVFHESFHQHHHHLISYSDSDFFFPA